MTSKIAAHPTTAILRLMDVGEFLRGAAHDRFTGEDPMEFIYEIIDLIEAGVLMRDTTKTDAWDEAVGVTEGTNQTPPPPESQP